MAEQSTAPSTTAPDGAAEPKKGEESKSKRPTKAATLKAVRDYFGNIARGDRDAQAKAYAPHGTGILHGQTSELSRDEITAYFRDLYAAFPDFSFEVLDIVADGDKAGVRWQATATFAGEAPFMGVEPNGSRIQTQGVDFLRIEDGQIVRNDAYPDNMAVARGIGLLPPPGSKAETRLNTAFNLRTRMGKRLGAGEPEPVADGVWLVRGGFPGKTMNVYLLRDGDGVMLFDAGVKSMTRALAAAGLGMGGITRVLLGHGHADHRGAAAGLGVPVYCHPAERADAEGDAGSHYFDLSKLNPVGRFLLTRMLPAWDGGPVKIAGTVDEGEEIAGFRVVHLPGHAPGLIGLWRESDRLALVSDCFYTLDPQTGIKGAPRVPHVAFNQDTEQARASIRKLAEMEPGAAWPGHAEPLVGDVRSRLEQAAATT